MMSKETSGEQRSAPRVDIEPDFCVLETLHKELYLGVVRNVSRTGALVDVGDVSNSSPSLGDASVSFTSTPEFLQSALLHVKGRSVWTQGMLLGVRFDHPLTLPQEELDTLQDHLESPVGPDWEKF